MTVTKLLLAKDAAEMLAISTRTLWTMTNAGEIPHIRIGRSVRYDPEDIARWIKRKKRKSSGATTAEAVLQSSCLDQIPATTYRKGRTHRARTST